MLVRYVIKFDTLIDDHLLNQIPPKVWKSSTTKFLDPAAGGGQILIRIAAKLRKYGHSDANIRRRVVGIFDTQMARMETDPEAMKSRANSWAQGYIGEFRGIKLQRGEDGLFRAADGADLPTDPNARVQDGALEGSNVSAVGTMVAMISAARQFEAQMKMLQTAEKDEQSAQQLLSANG